VVPHAAAGPVAHSLADLDRQDAAVCAESWLRKGCDQSQHRRAPSRPVANTGSCCLVGITTSVPPLPTLNWRAVCLFVAYSVGCADRCTVSQGQDEPQANHWDRDVVRWSRSSLRIDLFSSLRLESVPCMNVLALECSASMQPMRIEQHHMTMAGRQACRARTSSCAVATTRRSHTYTNLVPVLVRERPNMRHRQLARRLGTAQCSGPRRASLLGVGVVHLLRNGAAHPRASSPNQLSWQAVVANDGKVVGVEVVA
jgi:hypothetical protein